MSILTIAAHQVFVTFGNFLVFLLAHVVIMGIVHIVHLYMSRVKIDCLSLSFWIETVVNSLGSILLPSNIKYPRIEPQSGKMNQRYHEATSLRYLIMHVIFFVQNATLVSLSVLYYSHGSSIHEVFGRQSPPGVVKYYPFWSLGMFFVALFLKFMYYQVHVWPINPKNCVTKTFFCPRNQHMLDEDDEDIANDEYEGIEGKLLLT
jgi:hypothetical protein